ncbi:hypothetical protein [Sphingomonas sp. ERG5]|uniref:hypothetical protein n=1 Tax=Sphingomonas sp. ERG5 TaxID=1381597 RepID=UPI001364BDAA|nr:hypothetical protein [Sphingomonas sp. ERG5]
MPDSSASLIDELSALPAAMRNAILSALTAEERIALDALRVRVAAGSVNDAVGPTAGDDVISPWLATLIGSARSSSDRFTPATRQALLLAADLDRPAQMPGMGKADPAGRSLLGAMGGLLGPRKGRA